MRIFHSLRGPDLRRGDAEGVGEGGLTGNELAELLCGGVAGDADVDGAQAQSLSDLGRGLTLDGGERHGASP